MCTLPDLRVSSRANAVIGGERRVAWGGGHADCCDCGIVLANCDVFGDAVEEESNRIQKRYRTPRFAADAEIKERILEFGRRGASARQSRGVRPKG